VGYTPPVVRMYNEALIVGTTAAFAKATERLASELPSILNNIGSALSQRALPRGRMREINEGLARRAQSAVVSGWQSRLPRRGSSKSGTLMGQLGPALGNEAMIAGSSDRVVSFINDAYLDGVAAHWYHINYGAAGPNLNKPGGREARSHIVNINGRPFLTLRDDLPPAAVSYLPARFAWAGQKFFAVRGPGLPVGRGARAAHFVDLGLEVIANELGPAYDSFFREWVADTKNRARLAKRGIDVIADLRVESYGYSVSVH
jgi:hypothetical protein